MTDSKQNLIPFIKIGEKYIYENRISNALDCGENDIVISSSADLSNIDRDIVYIPCLLQDEIFQHYLNEYHDVVRFREIFEKFKAQLISLGEIKISLKEFDKFIPTQLILDFGEAMSNALRHIYETTKVPDDYLNLRDAYLVSEYIASHPLVYNGQRIFVKYNPFMPLGRYGLKQNSFGILSLEKSKRHLLVPPSDEFEFCEFDFNAFEIRTLLALCDVKQPEGDLYEILHKSTNDGVSRQDFKRNLIISIYSQKELETVLRPILLHGKFYQRYPIIDGKVTNCFGKVMETDRYHLLSRILQSTAMYILVRQIMNLIKFTNANKLKSRVAFCVHDSVCLLLHKEEREHIATFKNILESVEIKEYKSKFPMKIKIGKNYGNIEEVKA